MCCPALGLMSSGDIGMPPAPGTFPPAAFLAHQLTPGHFNSSRLFQARDLIVLGLPRSLGERPMVIMRRLVSCVILTPPRLLPLSLDCSACTEHGWHGLLRLPLRGYS